MCIGPTENSAADRAHLKALRWLALRCPQRPYYPEIAPLSDALEEVAHAVCMASDFPRLYLPEET